MKVLFRYLSALFGMAVVLVLSGCDSESCLRVNPICCDGMVMQQKSVVGISGVASPGTRVRVVTDWDFSVSTSAGEDSSWIVAVNTPEFDNRKHRLLFVTNDTTIEVNNILLGEVWLVAGQSNVEMPMGGWATDSVAGAAQAIRSSADSLLRFFTIYHSLSFDPSNSVSGAWLDADSASTTHFSALGYFFARELRDSLRVPVGMVQVSFGGAPARAWLDLNDKKQEPEFVRLKDELESIRRGYFSYKQWIDSLPSEPIQDRSGRDLLEGMSLYDDYVTMGAPNFDSWNTMPVPGFWENHGLKGFDGIVWFAHDVEIPREWVGKNLNLCLGSIDDRDVTYVNNTMVGSTDSPNKFKVQRVYSIPARVVSGTNLRILIRVIDERSNGGLAGCDDGENMRLELASDPNNSISIEGDWHYRVAAQIVGYHLVKFDMPHDQFGSRKDRVLAPSPESPGMIFNSSIAPLRGLNVAGVIWHQGEADVWSRNYRDREDEYLSKIISDFRSTLGNSDMPFIVAQISTGVYHGEDKTTSGEIRSAQFCVAHNVPNVYLVPTLDLGLNSTLRPPFKREEAHRISMLALRRIYDAPLGADLAPMPVSATSSRQIVNVRFDNGEGLHIDTNVPPEFEIAGADSIFYPAKALASDGAVTVFSHMVPEPVFVRYAFKNLANASLRNGVGLPAPTFFLRAELGN